MKFSWFEYNVLPLNHKALLLDTKCFLSSCSIDGKNYLLYSHADYYAEVCIDDKTNLVFSITAFKNSEKLEKYLDIFELVDLFY